MNQPFRVEDELVSGCIFVANIRMQSLQSNIKILTNVICVHIEYNMYWAHVSCHVWRIDFFNITGS